MRTNQGTIVAASAVVVLAFWMFSNVHTRMSALTSDARDGGASVALDLASQFHDSVSSGKPEVCATTDSGAFQSITGFPCAQFVSYLHARLGKAIKRQSAAPPIVVPARVILEMVTKYERGDAQEHFEYSLRGSSVTLTNYRIQADALNH